ncbi:MAG: GYD domain-containing protein [Chloroflexi bacterium]|nr:MAG: GYD domain-containing protein [Chloroflexota bacterium]
MTFCHGALRRIRSGRPRGGETRILPIRAGHGSPRAPSSAVSHLVAMTADPGQRLDRPSERAVWGRQGGPPMARFITFFSYTGEAAKAMIDRPSDRSAAAKALVESLGGTQEAFYWMQGEHDGFLITNLPDGVAAAALAAAVGASGAVVGLQTHQIYDHDEQAAIMQRAKTAGMAYKPPTA